MFLFVSSTLLVFYNQWLVHLNKPPGFHRFSLIAHKIRTTSGLLFLPIFLLRRMAFAAIMQTLDAHAFSQAMIWTLVNFVYVVWYMHFKPHNESTIRKIEASLEVCVLLASYHLLLLFLSTDAWPRLYIGFSLSAVIFGMVAIHSTFIIYLAVEGYRWLLALRFIEIRQWQVKNRKQKVYQMRLEVWKEIMRDHPPLEPLEPADYYRKKIKVQSDLLSYIEEAKREKAMKDLNKKIYKDLGNFGDIVELARL